MNPILTTRWRDLDIRNKLPGALTDPHFGWMVKLHIFSFGTDGSLPAGKVNYSTFQIALVRRVFDLLQAYTVELVIF